MHTDLGMTGISLSGFMPYMTVASLEMSDEPHKRQKPTRIAPCWLLSFMFYYSLCVSRLSANNYLFKFGFFSTSVGG